MQTFTGFHSASVLTAGWKTHTAGFTSRLGPSEICEEEEGEEPNCEMKVVLGVEVLVSASCAQSLEHSADPAGPAGTYTFMICVE